MRTGEKLLLFPGREALITACDWEKYPKARVIVKSTDDNAHLIDDFKIFIRKRFRIEDFGYTIGADEIKKEWQKFKDDPQMREDYGMRNWYQWGKRHLKYYLNNKEAIIKKYGTRFYNDGIENFQEHIDNNIDEWKWSNY